VVAGDSDANFALARYGSNGSLDPSFGAGGKVITSFGGIDQASAVTLQPDGKIVVAGQTDTGISIDFALARYMPDGSLDGAFGSGGRVTTNFTGSSDDVGSAVALQSDGKIVVGGASNGNFALARYTPGGTLDTAFGTAGTVTTNLGGEDALHALALQPDGAIVAVGESADRFALARYQAFGPLSLRLVLNPEAITEFEPGDPFRFVFVLPLPWSLGSTKAANERAAALLIRGGTAGGRRDCDRRLLLLRLDRARGLRRRAAFRRRHLELALVERSLVNDQRLGHDLAADLSRRHDLEPATAADFSIA